MRNLSGVVLGGLVLMGGSGCAEDTRYCTLEKRLTPAGEIVDEVGQPVTPTRVVRSDLGQPDTECELSAPNRYACAERGGFATTLTVFLGEREWSKRVQVRDDGCHSEWLTVDFTLEGARACPPTLAVEGDLVGLFPRDAQPEVSLSRIDAAAKWLVPITTACSLTHGHYQCVAFDTFGPADYEVRVDQGPTKTVALHIDGTECMPIKQHVDIDLTR